jgi:N6-adenosine-specific RNA methylase IME4
MEILKEFQDLIPPLTNEEYKQLENNCLEEGIREKIITWNNYIIDGHNRYKIAQQWNLDYQIESKSFKSKDEVKEWMILNQFGRRNLSNYQRSVLALQLEDVFRAKAKHNLSKTGGDKKSGLQISAKPIINKIDTRKELSKVAAVSHDTIAKVKKIQEKAPEEIKQKLRTGEVSINAAYKEIKKEEKKEERINLIKDQINDIESGKLPELKGLYDVISVDPPWNYEGENKNLTSYDAQSRRVANPYPEMSTEDIKKIKLPLMNDCIVLLWTTHKFLPDALDILKDWNLEYKATFVWNKEKMGMGAWFRMQCEFCLIGIKGKPYWNNTKYRDILTEPRRQHSRKPDGFFNMINKITLGRKLEYFSREKREGWDIFGNDINKF